MGLLQVSLVVSLIAAWLCDSAESSQSFVLHVEKPISVKLGHTAILPCWLRPPQSAVDLEVNWHFTPSVSGGSADNVGAPILLYRERRLESPGSLYKGRVSFGLKDMASGGFEKGDLSLKLENVTIEDAGDYICYVSSDSGYDSNTITLSVTETGAPVLLQTVWTDNNMVNVSCESGGWYPKPNLRWSDRNQVLTAKSLQYSKDSFGLLRVQSSVLVAAPSEVSCSVGPSGGEMKEARLLLEKPPQADHSSALAGWVLFALVLVAALALFGWLYYRKTVKKSGQGQDSTEENMKLLKQDQLDLLAEHYVDVTLDKVENRFLTIKNEILRDANCEFPDGDRVTCCTAVKGTSGFSSGQHYWEVSLTTPNTPPKQSWWLGVTSASTIPQSDLIPSTSDGYWFLSSSTYCLQFNTKPRVSPPPCFRPLTVGVHLNYDSGEICFYNVEDKTVIGKLTATFEGEVFPLFNPGKNDRSSMKILHRKKDQNHSGSATEDCVVSVENQS